MFNNKIAVITGAASGIGKALAIKCIEESAQVVLADNNQSALQALQKELPNAHCVTVDVTDRTDIERLLQETLKTFGRVELLFNNAGIAGPIGPIWTLPPTSLQKLFDINLMSMIHVLQIFIPHMLKQNNECRIVNTGAMSGLFTYPYFSPYQISKHAVIALSEGLYHDLAAQKSKIKVSVLCPGWVKTNIPASLERSDTGDVIDLQWLVAYGKHIKNGMSPAQLADITFQALRENKFYIYTHPDMQASVKKRFEAILGADYPVQFEV